jgi:hypothetical protein
MNWEALGAIGEIVGAVAVIATLGYLAVQIRQNTKAVRRSSHQSAVEAFTSVNSSLIQDPEVTRIVTTGIRHPEELRGSELVRFERWVGAHQANMENLWFQYRDGIIETDRWNAYDALQRDFFATRGFSAYWEKYRHRYSSSYQKYIEGLRSS